MSKKTIIISMSIVFLLVLSIFLIFASEHKNRVKSMYEKMLKNKNYTFSMEEKTSEIDYKVSMIQRANDICIDMHSEEEHTTTLILENKSYFIMHDEKEYYDYGDEKIDSDIVLSSLIKFLQKPCVTGKEEINGITYYYEEYENDETDFIIFANINENSNIKIRFYFNGNNLCYIKNIIVSEDEKQEELIKTDLKYKVHENLFDIPDDYAEAADF